MARPGNYLNKLAGKELRTRYPDKWNSIRDQAYNVLADEWEGTREVSIDPKSGLIKLGNIIP